MLIRQVDSTPDATRNKTAYTDCPSCGYKNALAITQTSERTLYHCHAGCPQETLWRTLHSLDPFITPPRKVRPTNTRSSKRQLDSLWQRSQPAPGTLVEAYLKKRRITGAIPDSLRYLSHHRHKPTGTSWPVMLAAIVDTEGRLCALHRTYLAFDGLAKAQALPQKMTLGAVGGLACHLAAPTGEIAVTEGIETGLSVQLATGIPTWAALSAGGMRHLILPPLPQASLVTIAADADTIGIESAKLAALRWKSEGRHVQILVPSRPGTDFNDLLIAETLQC